MLVACSAAFCQSYTPPVTEESGSQPAGKYGDMREFPSDGWSGMPAEWFGSDQARRFAHNVLMWQTPSGGWPKVTRLHTRAKSDSAGRSASFDNNSTIPQMRFIGSMYQATGEPQYRNSFIRALDFILAVQMPSGGWPQAYPGRGYQKYVTYNDWAMIHVMELLRDVAAGKYAFVGPEYAAMADAAVQRGVECILKTQIVVNGRLTAWCQQYDPATLLPAKARAFELPSISAAESSGIVLFLMGIADPSPRVKAAVHASAAWFKVSMLTGIRVARQGGDAVVVADPNAQPLWARFYDIATNRPIFVSRDSVPRANLSEISEERRNGYMWYGRWPARVLNRYQDWCAKHGEKPVE